ncbi:MAG: M28 family peptidase, partial [Pyrinomonadaceae bacterium]|nr:M28 family peptidase [Pyrinomonadaceae bacterium]
MNGSTRSLSSSLIVVTLLGIILVLLPLGAQGFAQSEEDHRAWLRALDSLSSERMLADVRTLSGPSFNGRQAGSKDDLGSAYWVADQFLASKISLAFVPLDRMNVRPGSGGGSERPTGFMSKPYQTVVIAPEPTLQISTARTPDNQRLGTDFLPVLDSPSAHARAPIVFVGYGIIDTTADMNDYAGIDVNNCIVLFLRGKPDHFKGTITHADKVRIARQKGAVGYLTANGPVLSSYEIRRGVLGQPSAFYGLSPAPDNLPGAWISTSRADQIIAGDDHSNQDRLRSLQDQLNRASESRSFSTEYFGALEWESRQEQSPLINVIALLEGTDPQLMQEAIVIGAHRDHFGRQAGLLFPGADDNASGTAVMLEVARVLAKAGAHPGRTILFISFSGEEQGLAGSRLYVERPLVPTAMTRTMINIDHAGVGNGRLTVGVTGLEKNVALEAGQTAWCTDKLDVFGFFPGGDHVPFKEAGVPTITVVSGGV